MLLSATVAVGGQPSGLTADDVRDAAARYVDLYERQLTRVAAEEDYVQRLGR